MNDRFESRSLLLEQLESRSMLAAGFFAHSVDLNEDLNLRSIGPERNTSIELIGAQVRNLSESGNSESGNSESGNLKSTNEVTGFRHDRTSTNSNNLPHHHRVFGPRSGSNLGQNGHHTGSENGTSIQQDSFSSSALVSAPVSTNSTPGLNSLVSGLSLQQRVLNNSTVVPANQAVGGAAIAGSSVTAAAPRAIGLAAAFIAPNESDSVLTTAQRIVDEVPGLDALDSAQQITKLDAGVESDANQFTDPYGNSLVMDSDVDGIWKGLIEPELGLRGDRRFNEGSPGHSGLHGDSSSDSSSDDSAWEIRGETIKQLRDLAADPSVDQADDSSLLTDEVIATWFEGNGGLVDIRAADSPFIHSPLIGGSGIPAHPSDVAGVVLDATVGLHRSVSLISGGLAAPDSSVTDGESVRDAVLAAIAGEASSPVSPIDVQSPPKVSSIAYPGAVALASALVILGRRKSVRLFSRTQGRTAPKPR